ncbi:lymphocyte expansion molecule [Monomorium pharaonis]|uniref:lymphocyte expansion molecule n=1 Tax=Monomorium pharaonis TaxID=307658 RepID=UPI0017461BAA|nr:lymphocyte expansion molecule [Monomorium pharaonis]
MFTLRKYKTKKLCPSCYKWLCQCLVTQKKKPHFPFNSGTKLDNKLGLHPKLKAFAPVSPAVGSYDPRPIDCKSIISWRKQQEAEEFSRIISSKLIKEIIDQKSFIKIECGPGSHEISRWPESIIEAPCKSLQTNVGFGTVPRFRESYKFTTPGPGYTLRTHNPFFYLEQRRQKGFSDIPTFEFDNLAPRFRETTRTWSLPCNRYNVKHPNSLQVFLDKVISKRGPYDLFTGPRDETTIKRYWTRTKLKEQDNWPQTLPGEIEKLSNKCNYFKGKWSTCPRFTKKPVSRMMLQDIGTCYKDPHEPGPGHYNPRTPRKPSTLKRYPFDSNIEYVRPIPSSDIRPGPGRYKIKHKYRVKGDGWTCVFKSKVPKINFIASLA